jgi:hypothetical protein
MRLKLFLVALFAWLVGVVSGLSYIAVSGGWYEYHVFTPVTNANIIRLVNEQGWEFIPGLPEALTVEYLRRPRLRLWH